MRTNIEIDDEIMEAAMQASGLKTKKETVETALKLLATRRTSHAKLLALSGKVDFYPDYDYKAMREGR
jgi:Arc/MetJ family transcription regulator